MLSLLSKVYEPFSIDQGQSLVFLPLRKASMWVIVNLKHTIHQEEV